MRAMLTFLALTGWLAAGPAAASKLTKWAAKHSKPSATATQGSQPSATVSAAPAAPPPPPPSTQILDGENGFRGVPFGADATSSYFFGSVTVNAGGPFTVVTRPADALTQDGVRLNRILWIFASHKLEAVIEDSVGDDNAAALQKGLEARYGAAKVERLTGRMSRVRWAGKVVDLTLDVNRELGTVTLAWTSVAVRKSVQASLPAN